MSHATFKKALAFTLRPDIEGVNSDDPDDAGGRTRYGITQAIYDTYRDEEFLARQDVFKMSDEERDMIYFERYWIAGRCEGFDNDKSAIAHFDACVNTGIGQASKFVQRAVGVKDDGIIGMISLHAINVAGDISEKIIQQRRDFYIAIAKKGNNQKFLKGWLLRCEKLEKYIGEL